MKETRCYLAISGFSGRMYLHEISGPLQVAVYDSAGNTQHDHVLSVLFESSAQPLTSQLEPERPHQ